MRNTRFTWHGAAWLALCGMCLPTAPVLGKPTQTATAASPAKARVHDVALGQGGMLVGQIVDESMQPVRGTAVVIQANGKTAAATTTDANGVFAVNGLRGGVHQVATGNSVEHCRLWTPGTAPPQAVSCLRLIPGQGDVVRGQWSANSMLTNPWVVGGIVVAAVGIPVLLHNLDDDDDDES